MTAAPAVTSRPRALTYGNVWLSVLLLAVMALYPFVFGKSLNFGVSTLLLAGFAMSWNILGGWTGQLSLGHAALLGIGAYTVTLFAIPERAPAWLGLAGPVAPWWGALIGMALAALLALRLGTPDLRAARQLLHPVEYRRRFDHPAGGHQRGFRRRGRGAVHAGSAQAVRPRSV